MPEVQAFIDACIAGDATKVSRLLVENLMLANALGQVRADHREFMKKEGADRGWTVLHLAAHYGHAEVVGLLLAAGAGVNTLSSNSLGNTPLMAAIAGGKAGVVQALLSAGADPLIRAKSGLNAQELARLEGTPEIRAMLEGRG